MRSSTARAWGFGALGLAAGLFLSRLPWWTSPPWWAPVVMAVIGGLLLLGTYGKEE